MGCVVCVCGGGVARWRLALFARSAKAPIIFSFVFIFRKRLPNDVVDLSLSLTVSAILPALLSMSESRGPVRACGGQCRAVCLFCLNASATGTRACTAQACARAIALFWGQAAQYMMSVSREGCYI